MKKKFKEHNFSEYDKAAKDLFIALFGKEVYEKLNSTPLKAIDWKGLDIEGCYQITATTPNIKDRFTPEWVEYFSERGYSVFDLFLQSVHHYGYANSFSREKNANSLRDEILDKILKSKDKE